jgi:putative ABC transport system permease protein
MTIDRWPEAAFDVALQYPALDGSMFRDLASADDHPQNAEALRWLADAGQDVRYLCRTLRKSPGFGAAVILTFALGIGANTAVFSVVNAVLLKSLPYPDPDRIVLLMNTVHGRLTSSGVSAPKIGAWRDSTTAFTDVSAYTFSQRLDLTNPADPQPIPVSHVSVDFFRLFGARAALGRTFSPADDRPGGPNVVVVSDGFWRSRLGGSTDVVGHTLSLDGDLFTIIGVLDARFDVDALKPRLAERPAIWLPLQMSPNNASDVNDYLAAGRLRAGASFEAAQAQTARSASVVRRASPGLIPTDNGLGIDRLQAELVRDVRPSLLVLWSVVAFALLVACANTINLLLVRASGRRREIAIRVATGASRARIARQLVTEGLVLAMAGGGVGLVLGAVGTRVLLSLQGWALPRVGSGGSGVTIDVQVLILTLITSVATGIVFGLAPAYWASRLDLDVTLRMGSRLNSDLGRPNVRGLLVVSEVALAIMLLIGSALLIRSFVALRQVNPGFDAHHVLTMQTAMIGRRLATAAPVADLVRGGLQRLNALPGVEVAGSTFTGVPFDPCCALNVSIVGRPRDDEYSYAVDWNVVSQGYFDALKIPLVRGRRFTERDDAGATPIALINQAMAKRYWPDADPLRDAIVIAPKIGGEFEETVPRHIVGIVGDVRDYAVRYGPRASVYVPIGQVSDRQTAFFNRLGMSMTWIVRTRGEPRLLAGGIQQEIRTATGGLLGARVRSMDDLSAASTSRDKLEMWLVTIFGAVAMSLAAVGLHGVISYSVQQRRHEIGIRMALGAESHQLRRMVLTQAMRMTSLGIVVGLVSALGLTRFMVGLLFGVGPYDRTSFVTVPVVLCAVALVAAWLPARRASSVDPMIALRAE